MTQNLFLKLDLLLNTTEIKEAFSGLSNLNQSSLTIEADSSKQYLSIEKVFYIKASAPVQLIVGSGEEAVAISINSSCLLTNAYDSVVIVNQDTVNPVDIYCVTG